MATWDPITYIMSFSSESTVVWALDLGWRCCFHVTFDNVLLTFDNGWVR